MQNREQKYKVLHLSEFLCPEKFQWFIRFDSVFIYPAVAVFNFTGEQISGYDPLNNFIIAFTRVILNNYKFKNMFLEE
jgi:hypothetical protein